LSGPPNIQAGQPGRGFRRLLKNIGWLFGSSGINAVISAVQGLLVARWLGVEQFGVFAVITAFTTAVNQLVDSRVWETAIQFVTRFRAENRPDKATAIVKLCYVIDLASAIVGVLLIWLLATWAAALFVQDAGKAGLIRIYALSILFAAPAGTSSALLRVAGRFRWLAARDVISALLRMAGVIAVLLLGYGVAGLIWVYVVAALVDTSLVLALLRPVYPTLGLLSLRATPLRTVGKDYRPVLTYLAWSNVNVLLKMAQAHLGTLLAGAFLGPKAAGYLRLARRLTDLMIVPAAPVSIAVYPEFARLWHERRYAELKRSFWRLTILLSGLAVAMGLGLVLFGGLIIRWTVGPDYLPALPVLYWLVAGTALAVAMNCVPQLTRAIGRMKRDFLANFISVVCHVVALRWLLPVWGLEGAGIAHLVLVVVWAVFAASTVRVIFASDLRVDETVRRPGDQGGTRTSEAEQMAGAAGRESEVLSGPSTPVHLTSTPTTDGN
jgi:O-antigen/teichoic acid export membrane protein